MSRQLLDPELDLTRPGPDLGQRLNVADCALLSVDRTLREIGCPGFETQMFLWLSSRADADGLRDAIARLSRAYPVLSSRLVEGEGRGSCYWRARPGAECPLKEIDLTAADTGAVLDCASRLLSTPRDPAKADPIRFYLLHRPAGRDVFLVQYNHTLMDISNTVPLIREIDRLCQGGADTMATAVVARSPDRATTGGKQRDVLREHLRQFPVQRRKAAMRRTMQLWWQALRGGAAMLGSAVSRSGVRATTERTLDLLITTRQLDAAQTTALQARVVKVCGFPSLSMAIMASAFRAIERLAPPRVNAGDSCIAGIGVDLGLRGKKGLTFQNLVSVVPVRAPLIDLKDLDQLTHVLSRQFRERLADEIDLGMLQCLSTLSGRPRQTRWLLDLALKTGFSLWYAYFGALDAVGDSFCGAAIDNLFYTGPSWAPMGMTLLANQFRGRLCLQATYVPDAVPTGLAEEFLDAVVEDLTGEG
jgi:hypothetical protein